MEELLPNVEIKEIKAYKDRLEKQRDYVNIQIRKKIEAIRIQNNIIKQIEQYNNRASPISITDNSNQQVIPDLKNYQQTKELLEEELEVLKKDASDIQKTLDRTKRIYSNFFTQISQGGKKKRKSKRRKSKKSRKSRKKI